MVGNHDAVHANRQGSFCIFGMKDAFHDHRPFPKVAQAGELLPIERATQCTLYISEHLDKSARGPSISLDAREARDAVPSQRSEPPGSAENIKYRPGSWPEWHSHAAADLSRTNRAHASVQGRHQHMRTRRRRAAHEVNGITQILAGQPIELKPENVGRQGCRVLD